MSSQKSIAAISFLSSRRADFASVVLAACVALVVAVALAISDGAGVAALLLLTALVLPFVSAPSAVILLLVWLPFEGFILKYIDGGSIALIFPDAMSLSLVGAFVIERAFDRRPASWGERFISGVVVALVVVIALSQLVNRETLINAAYWTRVTVRYTPLALVASVPRWGAAIRRSLPAVAYGVCATQSAIGLLEWVVGMPAARFFWSGVFSLGAVKTTVDTLDTVQSRMVAGTLSHYNIFGLMLVLYIGVMVTHLLMTRMSSSQMIAGWSVLLVSSLAVVISQSRQSVGALGACFIALLLFAFVRGSRSQRRVISIALGVVCVLGLFVLLSGRAGVIDRFGSLLSPGYWQDRQTRDRGYVVLTVVPTVLSKTPLLGAGPGSFHAASAEFSPSGPRRFGLNQFHAGFTGDVGWASIAVQMGLAGLAVFMALGWLLYRASQRSPDMSGFVYLWTCVAFVVGMVASSPLQYKATSSIIWLMFGLATLARDEWSPVTAQCTSPADRT